MNNIIRRYAKKLDQVVRIRNIYISNRNRIRRNSIIIKLNLTCQWRRYYRINRTAITGSTSVRSSDSKANVE